MSSFAYEESTIEHLKVNRIIENGFMVENNEYHGSIFFNEAKIIQLEHVRTYKDLTIENITPLLEYTKKSDMLLLGCGESFHMWQKDLDVHIRKSHLAFEYMNTRSAVDSLTILQAENRHISTILIPLGV